MKSVIFFVCAAICILPGGMFKFGSWSQFFKANFIGLKTKETGLFAVL